MSGSAGHDSGVVFLAHAWCPDEHRKDTVGGWEWWNVYSSERTAAQQALRASLRWKSFGRWEVLEVGGAPFEYAGRVRFVLPDQLEVCHAQP